MPSNGAAIEDSVLPVDDRRSRLPRPGSAVYRRGRWPVEVKLHGDFRSRRLKNTSDELRHQDVRLRQILVDSCRRVGLVVAGYSGRDDSVTGVIEEALKRTGALPAVLFWLHRGPHSAGLVPDPIRVATLAQPVRAIASTAS